MNRDLNHATRRLLQVVLDMLSNPEAEAAPAVRRVGHEQPRYRTSIDCVEAAWRAAREAQQMLAERQSEADTDAREKLGTLLVPAGFLAAGATRAFEPKPAGPTEEPRTGLPTPEFRQL